MARQGTGRRDQSWRQTKDTKTDPPVPDGSLLGLSVGSEDEGTSYDPKTGTIVNDLCRQQGKVGPEARK